MQISTHGWNSIDSQRDLEQFDRSACWDDSHTIEFYGLFRNESYFPKDVSRSGHDHPNLHLFCRVHSTKGACVHIVLIDCDMFSSVWISSPYFQGRVDSLLRIEVYDGNQSIQMRCSRLVYRFSWDKELLDHLFLTSHLVDSKL